MLPRSNGNAGYRRFTGWADRRRRVAAVLSVVAIAASGAAIACRHDVVGPEASGEGSAARSDKALGALTKRTVGAYHNEYLDFVFPRLAKAVAAGSDQRKICIVIAQAMRDFVVARKVPVQPATIRDDIAGGRCAESQVRGPRPIASRSLAGDGTPVAELDAVIAEMAAATEAGYGLGELAELFEQKVAYARATFPEAEADVVEAAASVGLSSVQYWEANYATQVQTLMESNVTAVVSRVGAAFPGVSMSRSASGRGPIAPPERRLQSGWAAVARRLGLADLGGAVKGGIKGWSGGLSGIITGALIEGGAASAGALIAIAVQ